MQKTVALSTCEAEFNAAVLCVQDLLCGKNLLEVTGLEVELRMILEVDNKGLVDIVNSFSVGGWTRHINVKLRWIPGSTNNADMFTKNLDGPLFKEYAEMLLGNCALDMHKTSKP